MRHTEFWERMRVALGAGYYRVWADQVVLTDLDSRTAAEALAAGESPKRVWAAVSEVLELPARER